MRVTLIYGLERQWKAAKVDVKTAFLQAKSDEELYLRMPSDLPPEARSLGFEAGGVYRQLKAVYGRMDSPRLFTQAFKAAAKKEGWDEVSESILVRQKSDGVLLMHMDDIICLAADPEGMLKQLGQHFEMGPIELLKPGIDSVFTGLDIVWDPASKKCIIGQGRYVANINTGLSDKEKKKAFGLSDLKRSEPGEVVMDLQKAQQAWTGMLGWVCHTQPHLSVVFSEISRNSTTPSKNSVLSAKRACEYAIATHRPLSLCGVTVPVIVWWVDASYSIYTCDGRLGWEVQILDESELAKGISKVPSSNIVHWKSKRCERKLASTTSAELCALKDGIKMLPAYTKMCKVLWGVNPRVVFVTDSQPMLGWLRTGWVKTDPLCQGDLDLVKGRLDEQKVEVLWVGTAEQRADRQTKFVPVRRRQSE